MDIEVIYMTRKELNEIEEDQRGRPGWFFDELEAAGNRAELRRQRRLSWYDPNEAW